jgi:pyrroloquinoline quinone biosynthesis protein D
MITETGPRLARKARLRYDRLADRYVLLTPERGFLLNQTAGDILRLCDGTRRIGMIAAMLHEAYPQTPRHALHAQIQAFLESLALRGLLAP